MDGDAESNMIQIWTVVRNIVRPSYFSPDKRAFALYNKNDNSFHLIMSSGVCHATSFPSPAVVERTGHRRTDPLFCLAGLDAGRGGGVLPWAGRFGGGIGCSSAARPPHRHPASGRRGQSGRHACPQPGARPHGALEVYGLGLRTRLRHNGGCRCAPCDGGYRPPAPGTSEPRGGCRFVRRDASARPARPKRTQRSRMAASTFCSTRQRARGATNRS